MLLSNYLNKYSTSYLGLQEFYGEAYFLRDIQVPSPTMILQHQKEIFKEMNNLTDNFIEINDPILKQLNNDLLSPGPMQYYFNNIINEDIKKIETYIETLNSKDASEMIKKARENSIIHSNSVGELVHQYSNFLSQISKMSSINEIRYALIPIEKKLNQLREIAKENSGSSIEPTQSLCGRVAWTEACIKGQFLEEEGVKFFRSKLPGKMVLHSGQLRGYYDIFGKYKDSGQMKEDIMIFDENIMVSFTVGDDAKKVYTLNLRQFIKWMKRNSGRKTIRLTQESYNNMLKKSIANIQAKATKVGKLHFGKINIRTAKKEKEGEALNTLKDIYQSTKRPILVNEHPDYNALFNYNLARNLNHIIGNNNLLLTREGITDMKTYILQQFDKGKYFYGEGIKLSKNAGNTVVFDM